MSYYGALQGEFEVPGKLGVIDIGGGSTEFIIGQNEAILSDNKYSHRSSKTNGICFQNDPVTVEEMSTIRNLINKHIHREHFEYSIEGLIGVGGNVTTLAALNSPDKICSFKQIDRTTLSLDTIQYMIDILSAKTLSEKEKMPNMPSGRADII